MFDFWKKKKSSDTPLQQQTVNGSNSGQVAQAGGSVTQSQNSVQSQANTGLSASEVASLISHIVEIVQQSELSEQDKSETISYLNVARGQATKESPDKGYIAQTLKQIATTLQSTQSVYLAAVPILEKIQTWLGVILV